jgi:hypothetical protein
VTPEETKGRTIVLVIIVGTLLLSAIIIGAYCTVLGTSRLPVQLVRFVLTAGLMGWLYRGSAAAKWITVVCCGLAGTAGIVSLLFDSRPAAVVVKLGTLYLSFAWTLVTSTSANAFLNYRSSRPAT